MCVGGVETVENIVRQYAEVGIDELIGVAQFNHVTHEQTMNTIRLMGERIIPKFKNAEPAMAGGQAG